MPSMFAEPDPTWPQLFAEEASRIRSALGDRALQLEHVGSTSVHGLPAKPIIDVLLVVGDAGDEASYAPSLATLGYVLHGRDLAGHPHRFFKGARSPCHVHVFSEGSAEAQRMVLFRDRLRADATDRELYLETKRRLAEREWGRALDYAEAKGVVVEEILERVRRASSVR
jgi:GrpB-like predicted nucleotidyltransferase (UPF0157 family)